MHDEYRTGAAYKKLETALGVRRADGATGGWWGDVVWAFHMFRIRRARRAMSFSRRVEFDEALRPKTSDGARVAYPDAIYHIRRVVK